MPPAALTSSIASRMPFERALPLGREVAREREEGPDLDHRAGPTVVVGSSGRGSVVV